MSQTDDSVRQALRGVSYPGFSRDIVSFGVVRRVQVDGGAVRIALELGPGQRGVGAEIERDVRRTVAALPGVTDVTVTTGADDAGSPALAMAPGPAAPRPSAARDGGLDQGLAPGVRHFVAVASGKGGVGKSTVAVNLAVALARGGARVGLLDADIYGPSIPLMMGMRDARPEFDEAAGRLVPFERFGVRFMSLGFLVEADSAVIWRGPMVMKAIEQLLRDVAWGDLDYLVVDMPPGTGDAQLTLAQRVSLAGAVVVTTPQDVALADAIKAVAMFRKVDVPVLGIVENMSFFECPHCHERTSIFGADGGKTQAERLGVPFLGGIPLHASIRVGGDEGRPIAAVGEDEERGRAFMALAARVAADLPPAPPAGDDAPADGGLLDRFKTFWKPTP